MKPLFYRRALPLLPNSMVCWGGTIWLQLQIAFFKSCSGKLSHLRMRYGFLDGLEHIGARCQKGAHQCLCLVLLLGDFMFTLGAGGSNGNPRLDSEPRSDVSHSQHNHHLYQRRAFMFWLMRHVKFTPNELEAIKPFQ